MTPLEILVATLNGQKTPRIPVFCHFLDHGPRELKMTPEQYFSNADYIVEGQLRLLKRYAHDNVWGMRYVGAEAEILGCQEILYPQAGAPNVKDFVIKSWDDIVSFEVPKDITQHPAWQITADCLTRLSAEVGSTHPICAYASAANSLPIILMGMEKWMELVLTGPVDLREELMRKCSEFCQQQLRALRKAGAHVILYATSYGSPYFIPKKMIADWSMPWMQEDFKEGASGIVYYCGGAPMNDVVDLAMEKLAVGVYYISPLDDLVVAKQLINNRGITCGVIDDIKMIHWSPEQTRAEVKRIIDIGKPGGHFLFGSSLLPLNLPEENIKAMIQAAFDFGRF